MTESPHSVSQILDAVRAGKSGAEEQLLEAVYHELRRMARVKMAQEPAGHTLQPTALVNEMYIKMFNDEATWENRQHFFGAAARAMRQILVDRARRVKAAKRDHDRATLNDQVATDFPVDVLALDEALDQLTVEHERKAQVVMYRYFLGLNIEETAELVGISRRAVDKDWKFAKCGLRERLSSTA